MQNTQIFKNIVKKLVDEKPFSYFSIIKHLYSDIYVYLISTYRKLAGHPLSEYVYWFIHDITDFPKCKHPTCNNIVAFINISLGYREYCSRLCMQSDPVTELKRQNTNEQKYGVKHAQLSLLVKDIVKKNREEKIKNDPNYLIDIGNAISNGFKKKELENPNYWSEREEKSKQTKVANGHDPNWNNREKYAITVSNFPQDKKDDIKAKKKHTREQKIKENPNFVDDIIVKTKKTKAENKRKNPNYLNDILDKRHKTKKEKYGDPYFRNSKKTKLTCLELYGVESYTLTHEYHSKRSKKYKNEKYPLISFDSKLEFIVYDFCITHNINVQYLPTIRFEYTFNNKNHFYKPDFLINGKIYEIKGNQFFKKDGTMFCPYRMKKWSDKQYNEICELYKAKLQCMITNDVIILKNDEIKNLERILL